MPSRPPSRSCSRSPVRRRWRRPFDGEPHELLPEHQRSPSRRIFHTQDAAADRRLRRIQAEARLRRIQKQAEFWLSTHNLQTDVYLRGLMDDKGYVRLQQLLRFPRMRTMGVHLPEVRRALERSAGVQLRDDAVRPTQPSQEWLPSASVHMYDLVACRFRPQTPSLCQLRSPETSPPRQIPWHASPHGTQVATACVRHTSPFLPFLHDSDCGLDCLAPWLYYFEYEALRRTNKVTFHSLPAHTRLTVPHWLPKPVLPRRVDHGWQCAAGSFDVRFPYPAATHPGLASPTHAHMAAVGKVNWLVGTMVPERASLRLRVRGAAREDPAHTPPPCLPHVWVGFADREGRYAYVFNVTYNFAYPQEFSEPTVWIPCEPWEGQSLSLNYFTRRQTCPNSTLRKAGPAINPLHDPRNYELGIPENLLRAEHALPDITRQLLCDGLQLEWRWFARAGRQVFRLQRVDAPWWWKEIELPERVLPVRPVVHVHKAHRWTVSVDIEEGEPGPIASEPA